jgi:hypothetical protein
MLQDKYIAVAITGAVEIYDESLTALIHTIPLDLETTNVRDLKYNPEHRIVSFVDEFKVKAYKINGENSSDLLKLFEYQPTNLTDDHDDYVSLVMGNAGHIGVFFRNYTDTSIYYAFSSYENGYSAFTNNSVALSTSSQFYYSFGGLFVAFDDEHEEFLIAPQGWNTTNSNYANFSYAINLSNVKRNITLTNHTSASYLQNFALYNSVTNSRNAYTYSNSKKHVAYVVTQNVSDYQRKDYRIRIVDVHGGGLVENIDFSDMFEGDLESSHVFFTAKKEMYFIVNGLLVKFDKDYNEVFRKQAFSQSEQNISFNPRTEEFIVVNNGSVAVKNNNGGVVKSNTISGATLGVLAYSGTVDLSGIVGTPKYVSNDGSHVYVEMGAGLGHQKLEVGFIDVDDNSISTIDSDSSPASFKEKANSGDVYSAISSDGINDLYYVEVTSAIPANTHKIKLTASVKG